MSKRLYVGNLSFQTTENELASLFEQTSEVESVKNCSSVMYSRSQTFSNLNLINEFSITAFTSPIKPIWHDRIWSPAGMN